MVHLEGLRQAIHTAAEQLRALSDDELVALALKASPTRSLREEIEHEKRAKPARKAKPLPRGPKPEPAKPAGSSGGQQILDALASCPDGMTAGELAKKLRRSAKGLGGGLGKMQTAGRVRRLDDGRWVVAGRQAGARKTARPVRSSDEEEGGAPARLVPPVTGGGSSPEAAPSVPSAGRSGVFRLPVIQPEPEPSYDQRRGQRKRQVRSRTIAPRQITKTDLAVGAALYPEPIEWRPRTRRDCEDGVRPCPYVACQYHLYLDVSAKTGTIKLNFPDLEPDELVETCALDVADSGRRNLEEVGELMNITRERIRQLELVAMTKARPSLRRLVDVSELHEPTRKLHHEIAPGRRTRGLTAKVIAALQDGPLHTSALQTITGRNALWMYSTLSRLVAEGRIRRVSRGVYELCTKK